MISERTPTTHVALALAAPGPLSAVRFPIKDHGTRTGGRGGGETKGTKGTKGTRGVLKCLLFFPFQPAHARHAAHNGRARGREQGLVASMPWPSVLRNGSRAVECHASAPAPGPSGAGQFRRGGCLGSLNHASVFRLQTCFGQVSEHAFGFGHAFINSMARPHSPCTPLLSSFLYFPLSLLGSFKTVLISPSSS